jgi:hypothetical protein
MAATLTATLDPTTARVSVSLNWTDPTPDPSTALIERVNADGSVVPVRGADPATLVAGAWVGNDYEAPLDATFYYQATSTEVPGTVLTSPTYTLSSGGSTWLKHPGRPGLNAKVKPTRAPDLTRPIEQGVFDVLGRTRPVATSMLRRSERGELALRTDTDNERLALLALVQDGVPLLFSPPSGYGFGSVYISIGDVQEARLTSYGKEPARYWSLPFTVVDRPSGGALAAGNSWSEALGAYPSWSQLLADEGTWTGLAEGIG